MSQYRSTVKDRLHLGFKSEVRRDARSPAIEAGLNLRGMVSPGEKIPPRYNSPLTARRLRPVGMRLWQLPRKWRLRKMTVCGSGPANEVR
jgi:hypothetical protein